MGDGRSASLARKILSTVREEGLGVAVRKSVRRARYAWMRLLHPDVPGSARWVKVRDQYRGRRAFLIGNGPSLNRMPLHLLRNELTMCFNRFHLMSERLCWTPTFFMSVDDLVLSDLIEDMETLGRLGELSFFPDIHFRGKRYDHRIGDSDRILWLRQRFGRGFSTDLPKVYLGGSVIYEGFQVLYHLGIREVYFIGVDMNFQIHETVSYLGGDGTSIRSEDDDDPNHFDPRYFGSNRKYHQPERRVVDYILRSLDYLSEIAPDLGFQIRNAGLDSRVDSFEKVSFRSLFDVPSSEERAWIDESLESHSRGRDWMTLREEARTLASKEEWHPDLPTCFAPAEWAHEIVGESVFTHVPVGPFEGLYCFVRRETSSSSV